MKSAQKVLASHKNTCTSTQQYYRCFVLFFCEAKISSPVMYTRRDIYWTHSTRILNMRKYTDDLNT